MGRKRINEKPLTGSEKQKRYREKRRAELDALKALKAAQVPADQAALRETIKAELRESWEPEVKQARIAEQKKKGRELAKRADHSRADGRIAGICECAAFFVGRDRKDIAQSLLIHFCIDRETATDALEADKRTESLTLVSLDKAGVWGKPNY